MVTSVSKTLTQTEIIKALDEADTQTAFQRVFANTYKAIEPTVCGVNGAVSQLLDFFKGSKHAPTLAALSLQYTDVLEGEEVSIVFVAKSEGKLQTLSICVPVIDANDANSTPTCLPKLTGKPFMEDAMEEVALGSESIIEMDPTEYIQRFSTCLGHFKAIDQVTKTSKVAFGNCLRLWKHITNHTIGKNMLEPIPLDIVMDIQDLSEEHLRILANTIVLSQQKRLHNMLQTLTALVGKKRCTTSHSKAPFRGQPLPFVSIFIQKKQTNFLRKKNSNSCEKFARSSYKVPHHIWTSTLRIQL